MTISPEDMQEAAKQHLWLHFTRMSSYGSSDVPVIVRGSGPYVYDDKGKRYLDGLAGLFVSMVGHGRTELVDAASRLWYPLWDAGFVLGHAVRTVKESMALAEKASAEWRKLFLDATRRAAAILAPEKN